MSQTSADANSGLRDAAARSALAQSFAPTVAGAMPFVDLWLTSPAGAAPGSGQFYVTIEADSAGSPSGTPLATSDQFDATKFWTLVQNGWVRFPFRTMPTLAAGTTYWIVLRGTYAVSGTNYLAWNRLSSAPYGGGAPKTYNGSAWSANAGDHAFITYVERDNAALTMPTDYTKSCLVGYVYNDASSNLQPTLGRDRMVKQNTNGADVVAAGSPLVPQLYAVRIPPQAMTVTVTVGGSASGDFFILSNCPYGFAGYQAANTGSRTRVTSADSNVDKEVEMITEFQAIHAYRFSGSGSITMLTSGFRW